MKKLLIMILLLTVMLMTGCGQDQVEGQLSEISDVSESIYEALGVEPYIPVLEYPIGMVTINYSLFEQPMSADIYYLRSTDERWDLDEDMKTSWENEHRSKVIYGDFFADDTVVKLTIAKDGIGTIADAELIEIEGHEVQYQLLEREHGDAVFIGIDLGSIGYMIQYHLLDGLTEEDARSLAADIIQAHR
jgi:predicted small secreted protein